LKSNARTHHSSAVDDCAPTRDKSTSAFFRFFGPRFSDAASPSSPPSAPLPS
jgi:hypothetical protein